MPVHSEIVRAAGFTTEPVAIVWTDEKPEGALEFKKGMYGCVMWLYAKVARDGRTAVFSRETFGCVGGAMGLGFGRPFEKHAAHTEEGFASFLSNGVEGAENPEEYRAIVESCPNTYQKKLLQNGERIFKNPTVAKTFLKNLPYYDVKEQYVVMKPLCQVQDGETIRSVIFLADADQISVLSILANYHAGMIKERVVVTHRVDVCHSMGVCVYAESDSDDPRAVIGLTDIHARREVRKTLGKDKLTFSVPYRLFVEMEKDVPGSILETDEWKELRSSD